MSEIHPTGTVTFLFTDIESSTALAHQYPENWEAMRARHHAILQRAILAHSGKVFQIIGDAFCAAFNNVTDGLLTAVEAQRVLQSEDWGGPFLKVRMGLHTGAAEYHDDEYHGYLALAHVQRVLSLGFGEQILLSSTSAELLHDQLPENIELLDLKEHRLKGFPNPERIWQVIAPGLWQDFPALQYLNSIPNNLPSAMTIFVGRERERDEVLTLLGKARLVTLIGSGGVGKTRLSLHVASHMIDTCPGGVWLVELAPVVDPQQLPLAVLEALGINEQKGKSSLKTLENALKEKIALIVLDNCEHLIEAAASFAAALLAVLPGLHILASSREALGVPGEVSFPVRSLAFPDANKLPPFEHLPTFPALQLFLDRAALVAPSFKLTSTNALAIAQICQRLDGIPLAIELAAARVRSMPLHVIVARLDDRFRLLTGGSRTALPRQQTLRALIDWSYDLLSETEKLVLMRLAVFSGGWSLAAAEVTCSDFSVSAYDVDDLISHLVDKSLVLMDESGRYHLLETIRQYARDRMFESGEGEQIRDRHAHYFLQLAESAEPEIRGRDQLPWLNLLEIDHENLRAAMEWTRDRDPETCLRLASIMWRFWDLRVYLTDAISWADQLLEHSQAASPAVYAKALVSAASFFRNSFDEDRSVFLSEKAAALAQQVDDKASLAQALTFQGEFLMFTRPDAALELFERALAFGRQVNDPWLICNTQYMLGFFATTKNEIARARSLYEDGVQQARLSGDNRRISVGLAYLAILNIGQGQLAAARDLFEEGLVLVRAIEDRRVIHERLGDMAYVDILLEDYAQADRSLNLVIKYRSETGDFNDLALKLIDSSVICWSRGELGQFAEKVEAAASAARQSNNRMTIAGTHLIWSVSSRITEKWANSKEHLAQALAIFRTENFQVGISTSLACFGMLAADLGSAHHAARLFGAAQKMRATLPSWMDYPVFRRDYEAHLASVHALLGEDVFSAAWQDGQQLDIDAACQFALDL